MKKTIIALFMSSISGSLAALAINLRYTNYLVGFSVYLMIFVICTTVSKLFKESPAPLLKRVGLQLVVFMLCLGLGAGIFYVRLSAQTTWIDSIRPEIAAAIATDHLVVPGVVFSQLYKDGTMDVAPCWDSDTIVYHNKDTYSVVVPVTRPLIFSISSFKTLIWTRESGWHMDRISWMISPRPAE